MNPGVRHYGERDEPDIQKRMFVSANEVVASHWYFEAVRPHTILVRITPRMNGEEYVHILSDAVRSGDISLYTSCSFCSG